ncbi:MAG: hypothetical protein FWD45_00235 [Coriobacteriia bacterium]|nr:hypothetical protein [Coriobacteriia bacterium]
MTDQIERIVEYVGKINQTISDQDLLEYTIEAVIDRALLYLGHDKLDERFERIIADVVNGVLLKYITNLEATEPDKAISSVSDNGQSISYSHEAVRYLAAADDDELFGGFARLLAPFRTIKVVGM